MRHFGNNDLYTYTVKRVVWERFPHVEVEYAFKNRDHTDLRPYIGRIKEKIQELHGLGPSKAEIEKLRATGYLADAFLEALSQFRMSADHVEVGERDGQFDLRIRGPWYQTIDLETGPDNDGLGPVGRTQADAAVTENAASPVEPETSAMPAAD